MPFARVGAMPQPVPNQKQRNMPRNGESGGNSRQKGITMEDLKKQTAIRLAQEQQQPIRHGVVEQNRDPPFRPLSEHQIHGYSRPAYPQVGSVPNHSGYQNHTGFKAPNNYQQQNLQQQPYRAQHYHQAYHPNQQPPGEFNNQSNRENFRSHSGRYIENQQGCVAGQQPNPNQHAGHVKPVAPSRPNDGNKFPHENLARYHRPAGAANAAGSRRGPSGIEGPSAQNSAVPSTKLPHGLTVHELKEMTKARLQAEALLDRQEPEGRRDPSAGPRHASPMDFDSLMEPRDRAMSRDSASRANHVGLVQGAASDSMHSIPSLVHVNQGSRDTHPGRQPQVSPLPPGFLSFASVGQSLPSVDPSHPKVPVPPRDNWPNQHRMEAWETASSASHNSAILSENLSADSATSGGVAGGMNAHSENVSFQRSRSYTYPAVLGGGAIDQSYIDGHASPVPAGASPGRGGNFFVPAVGANRRRACTMSPKPGSIHEDRPHFSGDDLALPSFPGVDSSVFLIRSRKSNYSPVLSQLGLENPASGNNSGNFSGTDGANRPRASSATSLPQLSHSGIDFPAEHDSSFVRSIGPIPSFAPGRERARSEDVSRGRHVGMSGVPIPPGFGSDHDIGANPNIDHQPGFSSFGSVNDAGGNFHGSAAAFNKTIGATNNDANDMGSVLLLSGAADRPDRERSNTFPSALHSGSDAFFTEHFFGKNPDPFRF